jgi:hypothetical protein
MFCRSGIFVVREKIMCLIDTTDLLCGKNTMEEVEIRQAELIIRNNATR